MASDQTNAGQVHTLGGQSPVRDIVLLEQRAGTRSHSMLIVAQTNTLDHVMLRDDSVGSTQGCGAGGSLRTSPRNYLLACGGEHDVFESPYQPFPGDARAQLYPPPVRIREPIDGQIKGRVREAHNREGCAQSKMSEA